MTITTYFVGTAGAGKSSLVAAYDRWCKGHGISTVTVNLDPGAEGLPYAPDVDIRDYIKLSEVMEEHELGPNGAQVAAADMIALNLTELKEEIDGFRGDVMLVDTPGQLELFVFRQSGRFIVDNLAPGESHVAYLIDPMLARSAGGFASQMLLAANTYFRLGTPMTYILSKADTLAEEAVEHISQWASDTFALENDILSEEPGMDTELAANISRLLDGMALQQNLVPTSIDQTGLDQLYADAQAALGGAEDATPEQDTFKGPNED